MNRQHYSSNSKWEEIVGYSRAVRVGNVIEVAGTTASDGDNIIGEDNMYEQTIYVFQKIEAVLKQAGATMNDVVRTRMYVTDVGRWEEVAKAHSEYFGSIKPAATMVEVSRLVHPDLLIEIEVTAMLNL